MRFTRSRRPTQRSPRRPRDEKGYRIKALFSLCILCDNLFVSGKEMVKKFKQAGWTLRTINGSHHVMEKNGHHFSIPVHASRDLKPGLEKAALKKLKEVT